jgi:hypothetical protein
LLIKHVPERNHPVISLQARDLLVDGVPPALPAKRGHGPRVDERLVQVEQDEIAHNNSMQAAQ